eukprot:11935688-Ditylum_brightwellii.AAC.1
MMPIELMWYQSVDTSSATFSKAVKSTQNVNAWTAACCSELQVTGVDPNTDSVPVMDLPVTLLCPWSASQKTCKSSSSKVALGTWYPG